MLTTQIFESSVADQIRAGKNYHVAIYKAGEAFPNLKEIPQTDREAIEQYKYGLEMLKEETVH